MPPQRRSSRVRREQPAEVYVADEDAITGKVVLGGADASGFATAEATATDLTHPDELPMTTDDLTEAERAVYEILRAARNAKARAMERSMFIVCNDRTLCEMVRLVPEGVDELYDLFGMGEKKVRAHGQSYWTHLRRTPMSCAPGTLTLAFGRTPPRWCSRMTTILVVLSTVPRSGLLPTPSIAACRWRRRPSTTMRTRTSRSPCARCVATRSARDPAEPAHCACELR